jgi:hypothetical protein
VNPHPHPHPHRRPHPHPHRHQHSNTKRNEQDIVAGAAGRADPQLERTASGFVDPDGKRDEQDGRRAEL